MSRAPHTPRTRQELYDQIRATSKEAVILEEMIRYGFWPAPDPRSSAQRTSSRIAVLEAKLEQARTAAQQVQDIDQVLQAERKARLAAARAQRAETRERRLREAKARAERWQHRKTQEILYLGEGVSAHLLDHTADEGRLSAQGLPHFADVPALATALGLTASALRFLCFHRRVSRISHYRCFTIPKKTGGTRRISAPMPRLKAAQSWVQASILDRVEVHPAAHGFRAGRSILSNAVPHVGAAVVINADLKDFFPTVTYPRVWGVFRSLGYAPSVSTVLALLCTEPHTTTVEMDGQTWFVARGLRVLPQGAPTSPALTNLLCRRLDRRLAGLAAAVEGLRYTRYADDLTFSGGAALQVGWLLKRVRAIVTEEGFALHPDKTRIMRAGSHQEVTGIVVNEKPNADRATLRRFRALLQQIRLEGPAGRRWGGGRDLWSALYGYASFVRMVHPSRGQALQAQVRELMAMYPSPPSPPPIDSGG